MPVHPSAHCARAEEIARAVYALRRWQSDYAHLAELRPIAVTISVAIHRAGLGGLGGT
jgi:hypothetical protein